MEQKKYSIIYADPPWRYDIKKGRGAADMRNSRKRQCAVSLGDISAVARSIQGNKRMGISI